MPILRMMLRVFTTIFGTTHPSKEEEDKYALVLFGAVVVTTALVLGTVWAVATYMK